MREQLLAQRIMLIDYLLLKVKSDDFHAVQDAASDIREIDAKLSVLNALASVPPVRVLTPAEVAHLDWPRPDTQSEIDAFNRRIG